MDLDKFSILQSSLVPAKEILMLGDVLNKLSLTQFWEEAHEAVNIMKLMQNVVREMDNERYRSLDSVYWSIIEMK